MWVVYLPADTVMCPAHIYYIGDARGALAAIDAAAKFETDRGWYVTKLHAVEVDHGVNYMGGAAHNGPVQLSRDRGLDALRAAAQTHEEHEATTKEDLERSISEIGQRLGAAKVAVLRATTFDDLRDAEADVIRLNALFEQFEARLAQMS